jgi:sulfur relay (sulfurtransferase) DsrF/TusC family protein
VINEWFFIGTPTQLTKYLRDANKLFVKDGYGKLTSQEALEFLQSIIESNYIKATIKLTQIEFENLFDLENKLQESNLKNQSLNQEIEELASELLEIKKAELESLKSEIKSKLEKNF